MSGPLGKRIGATGLGDGIVFSKEYKASSPQRKQKYPEGICIVSEFAPVVLAGHCCEIPQALQAPVPSLNMGSGLRPKWEGNLSVAVTPPAASSDAGTYAGGSLTISRPLCG